MTSNTPIEIFEGKINGNWPAIRKSNRDAENKKRLLEELLDESTLEKETSIVVFGSLARGEWTQGSDVDWTLLIDGPASREHRIAAQKIKGILEDNELKKPGQGGVFGNLAFSHDIVHQIGGQNDTNHNTTQRILLLSESRCIGKNDAYKSVISATLDRYLDDDISFVTSKRKIPRFLLNDIVRYWRIVAVDYAHKVYDRGGEGWAIRNIKLRFSRKLIFASGLLTCLSCELKPSKYIREVLDKSPDIQRMGLTNHIEHYITKTPLEILVEFLNDYAKPSTAKTILDMYNNFVELLSDKSKREELENLKIIEKDNKVFKEARDLGRKFQMGLESFFFEDNGELRKLTREYGVF